MLNLTDIVGQDDAIARLQRALRGRRMPHAFLFAGPEGVGRQTTAEAFARTLLCAEPVDRPGAAGEPLPDACGQCHDCRMMAAGSHPDYGLIYKELAQYHPDQAVRGRKMQELSIDVVRHFLMDPAYRASTRGRGKVFVLLEAELTNIAAQNALLKTLEEPPPGVRIILLSQKPDRLLPTTRSRCALVRFSLLPRAFVTEKLIEAGVPPEDAEFWAGFTAGSLGRALELAQGEMIRIKRELLERLAELPPGGDGEIGDHLAKVMDRLSKDVLSKAKSEHDVELSKQLADRRAAASLLGLLSSVYRDALTLSTGARRGLIHADQADEIARIADRLEALQLADLLESLDRYEQLLWRNVNPKTLWDNVALSCASPEPLNL